MYLFGAACSETGKSVALVLPESNTAMMNLFLQTMAQEVEADAHALLVLDQAAWHHSKSLIVPENSTLVSLPPYSPELNPMERVWAYLRSHYLLESAKFFCINQNEGNKINRSKKEKFLYSMVSNQVSPVGETNIKRVEGLK